MKTYVKSILLFMMLVLVTSVSTQAARFTDDSLVSSSYNLSTCPAIAYGANTVDDTHPSFWFQHLYSAWSVDAELGAKILAETYLLNQSRMRKGVEYNAFLRGIMLLLSNRADMLTTGMSKQSGANKPFFAASSSCDYYVFALRRILI